MDHQHRLFAPFQGLLSVLLAVTIALPGLFTPVQAAVPVQAPSAANRLPSPPNGPGAAFTDCAAQSEIPQAECLALVALYNGTDGPNWTNHTGWLSVDTPCTWYGITCAFGYVDSVNLNSNGLNGSLPGALGDLGSLRDLRLNNNNLSGSLPDRLGDLGSLTYLSITDNQLTGSIPPDLKDLGSLGTLFLQGNQLNGSIPPELGNLSNVTTLNLGGNQLSGSIPEQLGNLANLKSLQLQNNLLTGSIPASLGNLGNLEYLALQSNLLSGSIPAQLGSLGSLRQLYLFENNLNGGIPLELGNLTALRDLDLNNNQLSGSIPGQLGNLGSLTFLGLNRNQLTGSIPPQLGNLGSVSTLNLEDNHITGTLPSQLANLSNIYYLLLGGNRLSGSIPAALGDLVNLKILWLDFNQLEGEIPPDLTNLTSLTSLKLGYNRLTAVDASLLAFLAARSPDWSLTQTVPPTGLAGDPQAASVALSWTPIAYTGDGGYYEVSYATQPGGPFTVHGLTTDKLTSAYTIDGLSPNTPYYFRLRTYTPAHGVQQSELWSAYISELPVTTALICYTLTTSSSPSGTGAVTALPAANCSGGKYIDGTQVRLSAAPAAGYEFAGWSGDAIGSATPVTVTLDADKAITATFKVKITAVPPHYLQTFETGAFDTHWETETVAQGRVRFSRDYYQAGSYGLLLDDALDDATFSTAAAILHADLASNGWLRFWWRGFNLERHPKIGVFIRSQPSESWCQVMSFEGSPASFQEARINLLTAAQSCGMSLSNDFLIKFQFYGNEGLPTSGLALDDIELVDKLNQSIYLPVIRKQ